MRFQVSEDCWVSRETYGVDNIYLIPIAEHVDKLTSVFFAQPGELKTYLDVPHFADSPIEVYVRAIPILNIKDVTCSLPASDYSDTTRTQRALSFRHSMEI